MFRILICLSVICLFSLSSSQGFSQEFYQSLPTYSAPISYQPYSVQSFPVETYASQSYPVQSYPVQSLPVQSYSAQSYSVQSSSLQSFPVQYSTPVAASTQLPAYSSAGTQIQNYASGQGMMDHIIDPNYGYAGPGDMRTHLWNDHASDLRANGVSRDRLNSMSMATVQKWHNFFHGAQGRPSQ